MNSVTELAARLEKMEQELSQLRITLLNTEKQRDHYHRLYLQMMQCNRKLEVGLLGQKAERLPENSSQLSFEMLEQMLGDKAGQEVQELEVTEVRGHQRRKSTGRKPLPEHLPRVDIEIIPEEVRQQGLDNFKRIGEEVTEAIERRPASVVIARVIKPKFVRKDNVENESTQVLVGATPQLPIERGIAGPGMLADTLVKR